MPIKPRKFRRLMLTGHRAKVMREVRGHAEPDRRPCSVVSWSCQPPALHRSLWTEGIWLPYWCARDHLSINRDGSVIDK